MTHDAYLVGLRLAARKVVVVGAGSVAQRRLGLLIASGADVHVIAPHATPAVEGMASINLQLRPYQDGDLDGAWYAIACTDDPAVNAAVVDEAERRHIFCVRADSARDGTAVTPASFNHDGIAVGVLTGGQHKRSAALRSAIHEALQRGLITETADVKPEGVALVGGDRVILISLPSADADSSHRPTWSSPIGSPPPNYSPIWDLMSRSSTRRRSRTGARWRSRRSTECSSNAPKKASSSCA